jgi:broad specificity phosphatase PhoE
MSVEIIYFVHGTTTDNETKKCTGWLGGELSTLGIQQSKDLYRHVKGIHFDVIISSDLKRASDSARLTWETVEILHDKRLRECNYGDFSGKDEHYVNYYEHIDIPFRNGESLKDVEGRIREFVEELKQKYDGKRVALVAHKAPQLALEVIINRKSWLQALKEDWRNTKTWQPGWKYIV